MGNFDYRSILVDSGSIVQCCVIILVLLLAEKANKFCMTLECGRDEEIRLCIYEMTGETNFWDKSRNLRRQQEQKTVSLEHTNSDLSRINRFAEFKGKLQNSQIQKTVKWQNGKTVKWQNCEEVNLLHLETKPDWLSTRLLWSWLTRTFLSVFHDLFIPTVIIMIKIFLSSISPSISFFFCDPD